MQPHIYFLLFPTLSGPIQETGFGYSVRVQYVEQMAYQAIHDATEAIIEQKYIVWFVVDCTITGMYLHQRKITPRKFK